MMHLVLVIAVVFVFAASCLLTFALCRAATRRDMLEARWREESAGSVGEESHESARSNATCHGWKGDVW